jgi:hypothetical protein
MKTAIQTLFASALTVLVLSSSAFTTFAKDGIEKNTSSHVSAAAGYNMIKVNGNVQVYISQGNKESIRVVTSGAGDKVSVQKEGKKLLISSSEEMPASVYVCVKDLKRIEASDRSSVKSQGNIDLSVLQVFLSEQASAELNVNTEGLYTVVKDGSDLKLSGKSEEHILVKGQSSTVKTTGFVSEKTESSELSFAAPVDLDAQFEESLKLEMNPVKASVFNHTVDLDAQFQESLKLELSPVKASVFSRTIDLDAQFQESLKLEMNPVKASVSNRTIDLDAQFQESLLTGQNLLKS